MSSRFVAAAFVLLSTIAFAADEFSEAVAAFERGDTASAEITLHSILQNHPNDAAALGLLGAVLDAQKKYAEAESAYRRAMQLAPDSATLLNNFANHQLGSGDVAGARATYLKAIAIDPGRVNANLQLARIAVKQKNGAEALRYLDHLQPADRSPPQVEILEMQALFLAGRNAEANAMVSRFSSEKDPRLSFTAGLALADAAKYAEAEIFFARALEAAPANFDILYNLGLAAFHAGHLERAREVLQTALEQRPQDVDTLYNLAVVDIDLKQLETALSLLAEAARRDASRPNVQLAIAQTTSALGFYADSLLAYDRYLKLVPGDEPARRERSFMFAVSSHPREGLAELEAFSRSHAKDATAHYEVGILEARSDPANASVELDRAIALEPDFVPARFGRGVLNYLQGNYRAALPDLEFAAARYPDNAQVLERLGETLLALDRTSEAVTALRKAAEISPKDARILMHLSRALSKAGRSDEARATLARFRAIGPKPGNLIPLPGFLDFLSLSPEQQQARYREEVEKRVKQDPDDAELNVRYLKLLIQEGKSEEAAGVGTHLLTLKPPAPLAAEAGRALLEAEQYAQARNLLEYAGGGSVTAEVELDLAIAVFHTAGVEAGLAQLDGVPEARRSGDYYLARAQMLDAAQRPEEAYAALQRAVDAAPTRADLYVQAAGFLVKQGRPVEAVRLAEQGCRMLPDSPQILLLKAEMLIAAQRANEAEGVLKQIQNRWPEWVSAYVTYGMLLEREKRSAEAKTQLETALALGASGPGVTVLSQKVEGERQAGSH